MNTWVSDLKDVAHHPHKPVWAKQTGCRHCCVRVKTASGCIMSNNTHRLLPHNTTHQLYLIACSVWTEKKEHTRTAHHWYFIRNGWYLEKDEGGDRECARGNAEGCVQMGKGLIHTVTPSWKPVCRSSCLLQQPPKITLSICNQWKSCWGKEMLSARQSDSARQPQCLPNTFLRRLYSRHDMNKHTWTQYVLSQW